MLICAVIAMYILGIFSGFSVAVTLLYRSKAGTLRVDTSDPEDVPYLFLELERNVDDVISKRYALLEVDNHSYLPRQ